QTKVFRDIVPNQSLTSVTAIPETGELFITLSVHGGSSAKPVDKEAVVVLWDPSSEKITFRTKPVQGTRVYGKTVRADNGLIYGSAGDHIYVFDPNKRKVVTTLSPEKGPDSRASRIVLSESPASDGLLYGVDNSNGRLVQIKPYTNTIIVLDATKATVLTTLSADQGRDSRASTIVLSESPATDALMYSVDNSNGRLFQINPYPNAIIILAEHASIRQARFAEVKEDGYMYD